MKTTFIYALCEPGTRTVRYVGVTKRGLDTRLEEHLSQSIKGKTHLGAWLRSLVCPPEIIELAEVPEDRWSEEERRHILLARSSGAKLVNGNDGGVGCHNPSPETLRRMSEARIGEKNPMFGKNFSEEHRANISESLKGEKHPNFGKTRSGETCKRIGDAQRGAAGNMYGKHHTPESNAKRSASLKATRARKKARDQEIEWALAPYTLTD